MATLGVALASYAPLDNQAAQAKSRKSDSQFPVATPQVFDDGVIKIGEPYTIAGQRFEPKDDSAFDEVGYAIVRNDGGTATSFGEPIDPASIFISHRILPVPSYVELTNLETGKTILARVNDRGPMLKDKIAALSPGAAQLLGVSDVGSTALRVRRVNPPFAERAALRSGRHATERLDTPPALLSALKRQLAETASRPKDAVETVERPVPSPAPVRTTSRPVTPTRKPGATFEVPAPGAVAATVAKPVPVRVRPVAAPRPVLDHASVPAPTRRRGNDRFIVEDSHGQRMVVATEGPVRVVGEGGVEAERETTPARAAATAAYFVQLASFGDKGRAEKMARKTNGQAIKAGKVWRVRLGPFDQRMAQATLSEAVSKGYPEARILR